MNVHIKANLCTKECYYAARYVIELQLRGILVQMTMPFYKLQAHQTRIKLAANNWTSHKIQRGRHSCIFNTSSLNNVSNTHCQYACDCISDRDTAQFAVNTTLVAQRRSYELACESRKEIFDVAR